MRRSRHLASRWGVPFPYSLIQAFSCLFLLFATLIIFLFFGILFACSTSNFLEAVSTTPLPSVVSLYLKASFFPFYILCHLLKPLVHFRKPCLHPFICSLSYCKGLLVMSRLRAHCCKHARGTLQQVDKKQIL